MVIVLGLDLAIEVLFGLIALIRNIVILDELRVFGLAHEVCRWFLVLRENS